MISFSLLAESAGRAFRDLGQAGLFAIGKLEEGLGRSGPPVSAAVLLGLRRVARRMRELHGSPWPGRVPTGSRTLHRRSGRSLAEMERSLRVDPRGGNEVLGRISVPWPLASHEEAKTIRARGKLLTVPLPAALDSRGLPLKRSARDWKDTFVRRTRKGNLVIFQKRGGKVVPLYLLRDRVDQPARLRFGETIEAELPFFEARMIRGIENALEGR